MMTLKSADLKSVESYKTAIKAEAKKIPIAGTEFWAYKDVELPNAKGTGKTKVMLVSFGDQKAIMPFVKNKAPDHRGRCRVAEGGLVFEPTNGAVPKDVLGTLLGKPVRSASATTNVNNLVPRALQRAVATNTPLPPDVKTAYDAMHTIFARLAKANKNDASVQSDYAACRADGTKLKGLAEKFVNVSTGHLDQPEIKQAIAIIGKEMGEYLAATNLIGHSHDVSDHLKAVHRSLSTIAKKLHLEPPKDFLGMQPLPSSARYDVAAETAAAKRAENKKIAEDAIGRVSRNFGALEVLDGKPNKTTERQGLVTKMRNDLDAIKQRLTSQRLKDETDELRSQMMRLWNDRTPALRPSGINPSDMPDLDADNAKDWYAKQKSKIQSLTQSIANEFRT
jgi:hypothetical protein